MRKLDSKKLAELLLQGNRNKMSKLTNTGAALVANHANSLEVLHLYELNITNILQGNRPLVNLEILSLQRCSGDLDSILGICRTLKTLEMKNSKMGFKTENFSLPSLEELILVEDKMSKKDVAKLMIKLPPDMSRNDLI